MSIASPGRRRAERAHDHPVRRVVAVVVVVLVLLALVGVIAALSLSVRVSGSSMLPTIEPGDRLTVDVLHGDAAYERFDLVEARVEAAGTSVVKRVIGVPGDRLRITGGAHPEVLVRPRGASSWFVVDNSAWDGQVGDATQACCTASGTSRSTSRAVTVPDDSYFLMGDNWGGSTDSRVFGWVGQDVIEARLTHRVLPLGRLGRVNSTVRLVPAPG